MRCVAVAHVVSAMRHGIDFEIDKSYSMQTVNALLNSCCSRDKGDSWSRHGMIFANTYNGLIHPPFPASTERVMR
jgi:hypothetical protein